MSSGKTSPISPLVSTPSAQATANPAAFARVGRASERQKQSIASVSQRQTIASGMRMRVKMNRPKLVARTSAA